MATSHFQLCWLYYYAFTNLGPCLKFARDLNIVVRIYKFDLPTLIGVPDFGSIKALQVSFFAGFGRAIMKIYNRNYLQAYRKEASCNNKRKQLRMYQRTYCGQARKVERQCLKTSWLQYSYVNQRSPTTYTASVIIFHSLVLSSNWSWKASTGLLQTNSRLHLREGFQWDLR